MNETDRRATTDTIPEAVWTAPRPRWWEAWSEAEREAWLEWQTARAAALEATARLREQLVDPALRLWLREEERDNLTEIRWLSLVRARLQRLIPTHADVIETVFSIEELGWEQSERDPD